ncbi:hypothetical protein SAMN02910456_01014 [Ruminococcaceae bacterium YRB3002]|nr:hypothetical protein SAMN02910456_01014 [Ruminococcaceae bacterium YRB3002]
MSADVSAEASAEKKCPSCGGILLFDPGWDRLVCQSCGNKFDIPELQSDEAAEEIDIATAKSIASHDWGIKTRVIQCGNCGAETVNDALQMSGRCPFCGSTIVTALEEDDDMIAPTAVIPFKVSQSHAEMYFKQWIGKRFFAPSDIKDGSRLNGFTGIYLPYWTFDADTTTDYKGKYGYTYGSGDDEYTKWYTKSGHFDKFIDDYTVPASRRLTDDKFISKAAHFSLSAAKNYTPQALAGFVAERYTIGLEEAWKTARNGIFKLLEYETKNLESADTYKNVKMSTTYRNITFKYVLVPLWISSFTYDGKLYNIVINGQTGEVFGEWPKSRKKILILVGILCLIFGLPILLTIAMMMFSMIMSLFV